MFNMSFLQRTNVVFTIVIAFITLIGVEAALSQLMIILGKDFETILTVNLIYWIVLMILFLILVEVFRYERL